MAKWHSYGFFEGGQAEQTKGMLKKILDWVASRVDLQQSGGTFCHRGLGNYDAGFPACIPASGNKLLAVTQQRVASIAVQIQLNVHVLGLRSS